MATELEQRANILTALSQYLLFERKQETQLSIAFSMLVQERHNQFHTLDKNRIDSEAPFSDCKNEMCVAAFNILKESRSMAIEINDLTLQMVADYKLNVRREGKTLRAWLEAVDIIKAEPPSLVIPGQ